MERLVTPEAVELELDRATVASRIPGRVLDLVLQIGVLLLVGQASAVVAQDDVAVTVALLVASFVVLIVYPIVLETRFGATLGQRAMGLRIVSDDGAPIRLRQAVIRAAVGLFEVLATSGLVAFVVAASRADGKRLGDVAAGTVAVSVRVGTGRADVLAVECPPQLHGWAERLDTSGLTPAHLAALRRFHERTRTLPAGQRDQLAAGLAERLLVVLAVPRPAGAGARDVLAAIQWAVRDRARPAPTVAQPPPPPPRPSPQSVSPPSTAPPVGGDSRPPVGAPPPVPRIVSGVEPPVGEGGPPTDRGGFVPPA